MGLHCLTDSLFPSVSQHQKQRKVCSEQTCWPGYGGQGLPGESCRECETKWPEPLTEDFLKKCNKENLTDRRHQGTVRVARLQERGQG